jgi:hypothetical protein
MIHGDALIMSKEVLPSQLNNGICEADGCFEKATTKIEEDAGEYGLISLYLCSNCARKFQD